MHAALHAIGLEPTLDEMIQPQYLTGRAGGSTAVDLVNLAAKHGAKAWFRTGMTYSDLRNATSPVILHTSTPVAANPFSHWVAFLGMEEHALRIYDPPKGLYTVSSADLLSIWDGSAVVVEPPGGSQFLSTIFDCIDLELLLAILLVLVIGVAIMRISWVRLRPVVGIFATATVASLAWHVSVDFGFFGNSYARATILTRFAQSSFPIVTTDQLLKVIGKDGVTIVDVRGTAAYRRSHVPTAVNIPIYVSHGSLKEALLQIPSENHVIVYCQSASCQWAEQLARLLPSRGYRRVSIYRAGMNEFRGAQVESLE